MYSWEVAADVSTRLARARCHLAGKKTLPSAPSSSSPSASPSFFSFFLFYAFLHDTAPPSCRSCTAALIRNICSRTRYRCFSAFFSFFRYRRGLYMASEIREHGTRFSVCYGKEPREGEQVHVCTYVCILSEGRSTYVCMYARLSGRFDGVDCGKKAFRLCYELRRNWGR